MPLRSCRTPRRRQVGLWSGHTHAICGAVAYNEYYKTIVDILLCARVQLSRPNFGVFGRSEIVCRNPAVCAEQRTRRDPPPRTRVFMQMSGSKSAICLFTIDTRVLCLSLAKWRRRSLEWRIQTRDMNLQGRKPGTKCGGTSCAGGLGDGFWPNFNYFCFCTCY